jgi:hypothetical protein
MKPKNFCALKDKSIFVLKLKKSEGIISLAIFLIPNVSHEKYNSTLNCMVNKFL